MFCGGAASRGTGDTTVVGSGRPHIQTGGRYVVVRDGGVGGVVV